MDRMSVTMETESLTWQVGEWQRLADLTGAVGHQLNLPVVGQILVVIGRYDAD